MLSLVCDTETNGFPKKDHTDPNNAKLLQIYASLYDHDPKVSYIDKDVDGRMVSTAVPVATASFIVNAKVAVPKEAFDVHGIDQAMQKRLGVDAFNAACLVEDLLDISEVFVAHNTNFDVQIIRHFLWEHERDLNVLDKNETFCTMLGLKPIMRLTPKKYGDWRYPKLIEAYQYMFGRDFAGQAHDAEADGKAAADLYFGLLHMKLNS